jgi:hypothetical protein
MTAVLIAAACAAPALVATPALACITLPLPARQQPAPNVAAKPVATNQAVVESSSKPAVALNAAADARK